MMMIDNLTCDLHTCNNESAHRMRALCVCVCND